MHLQSEISACSAVPASGSDRILSYARLLKFKHYYKVEILSRIPSPFEHMMSFIRQQVSPFLTTPYDDCTFFQSQSTELVVFSPSAKEYVVIAW